MPGIFGSYKTAQDRDMNDLMERMILSMNYTGKCKIDRFLDEGHNLCMGRVSLGILNPIDQPLIDVKEECFVIFHGELYDKDGALSDPEYILKGYLENGDSCASSLNGIFHFAVYDKRTEQLKLFTDKFGLQPLYYSIFDDGIAFGGEVKMLCEDDRINGEPDYRSFADFLHFGQILGNKTLFKEVRLLAPGSVLTFNLKDRKNELKKYWNLENLFVEKGACDQGGSAEDAVSMLIESIRARCAQRNRLGLSLSGGLDSRGILAGLGKDAEGLHTYTLGLPGCADQKLAEKMAKVSCTRHEFIPLEQEYIQDFRYMAENMIKLSDGMYHPHESTEMLALEYFRRAKFKILLRGHGGEVAKAALAYPVMVKPEVKLCTSAQKILDYVFNITNLVIRDIDPNKLFTPFFRDIMAEAPEHSLKESCGTASENLSPADVCIYYYINEHIRRQVVASLDIFRSRIEIRMPYVDEDYFKNLFTLPIEERNTGEIHFKLIKRCMPELIKIPNSNTGAPLDAGPLRLFVTDKFNSLMKKLSIKGFRHYTEFQKWHRQGFKENSQKIIFSDEARHRKIYEMDYLENIFEAHVSGKKDYGHLLGTIAGLEIWFRIFVD